MIEVPWYQTSVLVLLIIGLLAALTFLVQHRPRQRWRWAAVTVTAWPALVSLFYMRSIGLILLKWPGAPPEGPIDATWSLTLLVLIDILLVGQLVSYRNFVGHDRDRQRERVGSPPLT